MQNLHGLSSNPNIVCSQTSFPCGYYGVHYGQSGSTIYSYDNVSGALCSTWNCGGNGITSGHQTVGGTYGSGGTTTNTPSASPATYGTTVTSTTKDNTTGYTCSTSSCSVCGTCPHSNPTTQLVDHPASQLGESSPTDLHGGLCPAGTYSEVGLPSGYCEHSDADYKETVTSYTDSYTGFVCSGGNTNCNYKVSMDDYEETSPDDGYCPNDYNSYNAGGHTICYNNCYSGRIEVYTYCATSCTEGTLFSGQGIGWDGGGGGGMINEVGLKHLYCTPYVNYDYDFNTICGTQVTVPGTTY